MIDNECCNVDNAWPQFTALNAIAVDRWPTLDRSVDDSPLM